MRFQQSPAPLRHPQHREGLTGGLRVNSPPAQPCAGQPHTSSPTLGAGTAGLRAVFLEEEPLELAGDV